MAFSCQTRLLNDSMSLMALMLELLDEMRGYLPGGRFFFTYSLLRALLLNILYQ